MLTDVVIVCVFVAVYCNASFDQFACWPESPPGNVSVPCPHYLPWIKEGSYTHCFLIVCN